MLCDLCSKLEESEARRAGHFCPAKSHSECQSAPCRDFTDQLYEVSGMKCVYCGRDELRRSVTRFWERPLRWLGFVPYRCASCLRRCSCLGNHVAIPYSFWTLSSQFVAQLFLSHKAGEGKERLVENRQPPEGAMIFRSRRNTPRAASDPAAGAPENAEVREAPQA